MKRLRLLAVFGCVFLLALANLPKAQAQDTQNFKIKSFVADYYLGRNSAQTATLHTVESITAQFPSYDQNHGILRAIPKSYQGHTVSLKIDSVTDENGAPINYTDSSQNDNLVLKIGDKNKFVHGLKTYKITYDSKNVALLLADHDEFYWDVNGDQWQQPTTGVTAVIHISRDLEASLQDKRTCYAGYGGSSSQANCQIQPAFDKDGGRVVLVSASNLSAGQTLTFVTSFNKGTFKLGPEIQAEKQARNLKIAAIAGGMLALPVVSFGYLYNRWRKYGRDPKGRGVIIPEYQPPKGLNALTSDYIFREALNNKAISALIVELAIRKYITIYEVKQAKRLQKDTTTYKLKLIKDPADLTGEEKAVITMFFNAKAKIGSEVDLSSLKNKLSSETSQLKKALGKNLFKAGYFNSDPNTASLWYYTVGLFLALAGFFFVLWIYPPAGVSIGIAGLIFLLFSRYMPARTQAGVEVHDHLLGLRDYISLAEADRLKFLQSPQGAEKIEEAGLKPGSPQFKVKLFESLLPYAMLFSLEKDWAKQFEDVYSQPPDWYAGNWGTFNMVYLASSLSGFNSASAVTFTSPSSSGGSGFSGGFSGGGGGGGGGGGW